MPSWSIVRLELRAIVTHWLLWFVLGRQDIQLRYRRSTLGPLWITISMAVTVVCMGFLYAHLFRHPLGEYFPYLASGIISWALLSALLIESSEAYVQAEQYIRNQPLPLSIYVMRLILRHWIIFLHNLLVFIPVALLYLSSWGWREWLIIPGALLLSINLFLWGSLVAMMGTRFRDFSQIIASLVQVVFFLTPIMWMSNALPAHLQWVVEWNPFNQMLNLIRSPMLGQSVSGLGWLVDIGVTVLGALLYSVVTMKHRRRVVFWL